MPKQPVEHMGFDLDGRALPDSPAEVRDRVNRALEADDSELVAVILRHRGDLMIQLMGPPSAATLSDLEQVLKQAVKGYKRVLRGQ